MQVENFIKVTAFDVDTRKEDRQPIPSLLNVDEIAFVIFCGEKGSCVIMKDYVTKLYVYETEKEIKYKINSARSERGNK